jgi:hypothetical protein
MGRGVVRNPEATIMATQNEQKAIGREGTPGTSSPAGGVRTGAASRQESVTGLAGRVENAGAGLAGGRSQEEIRGYLAGLSFPALKDAVVREARRNGAPEDVLGSLPMLSRTEYGSLEEVLLDYPRLEESDASAHQGR